MLISLEEQRRIAEQVLNALDSLAVEDQLGFLLGVVHGLGGRLGLSEGQLVSLCGAAFSRIVQEQTIVASVKRGGAS